ncbi:early nodulin-like protein 20 [Ziziphus jujuba]|uniref:Early nodulin-like protein 20 n=2 Tax=Ziziphus jujuba TaxID=326968 RepID=A0A6P3ZHK8_ZIZJJ|nr:early nodulin-like protein 20 [Ziziphus jujuba]KAH7517942.1 hypothetical protein FEM48_Zijuj09G0117800 [Ziziphus jujuba var. spinosa]
MASILAQGLMTMLITCMLGVCMANRGFDHGRLGHRHVYHHPNKTQSGPNKITVGGSENWHFGYNYTIWAIKHGSFYLNDILVFKYDAPTNNTHPHSVYLLPNLRSFKKCNFSEATMLASPTQGGDEGFEFALKNRQPYYFACGEGNGYHCNSGGMKFVVWPTPRGQNF